MSEYTRRQRLTIALGYARKWTGLLNRYSLPRDLAGVDRFVFVCKGNICRSAYAHAVAAEHGVEAASFGLEASSGRHADERASAVSGRLGLDLSAHRTTSVGDARLRAGDLLLCMEFWHARRCSALFPGHAVALLGLAIGKPNLIDPYGRCDGVFEREFRHIRRALEEIMRRRGQSQ